MDVNYDYNSSFKSISLKLRKRFLRKPNLSEAIDEYTALSRLLDSEDHPSSLSAYCLQQVARCHHSVGNSTLESSALQSAARKYLSAHIVASVETRTTTLDEDLLSAISVFDECIRVHCEQAGERQLAAKLCVEVGDLLGARFEKYFEAIPYYERAIVLFGDPSVSLAANNANASIQVLLICLKLAVLKVYTCDYAGALNLYTDICASIMSKCMIQPSLGLAKNAATTPGAQAPPQLSQQQVYNKPIGMLAHLLVDADIGKLLLLIYLKPSKMRPEHTHTIEVYSWFQALSNTQQYLPMQCMNRDLFILLQSFVMACQSSDVSSLRTLQTELVSHLSNQHVHNYLIDLIVGQLLNSSYTDDLLSQ